MIEGDYYFHDSLKYEFENWYFAKKLNRTIDQSTKEIKNALNDAQLFS